MSKNSLVTFDGVNVNMEVTKDDILAIAVSKYEQDLMAQLRELEKEYRLLAQDKKSKEKQLDKYTKDFLTTSLGRDLWKACVALEAATMGSFSYAVSLTSVDLEDRVAEYSATITANSGGRYNRESLSSSGEADLPQNLVDLATEITQLTDSIRTNCENRIEVKRDLDGIATKEREAKAHLAIRTLSQSEDGRAFLESLQTDSGLFLTDTQS